MIGSMFGLLLMVAGIVSFAVCVLAVFVGGLPSATLGSNVILSLLLMGVAEIVMRIGRGGGNG